MNIREVSQDHFIFLLQPFSIYYLLITISFNALWEPITKTWGGNSFTTSVQRLMIYLVCFWKEIPNVI
jgi:hypothetical protein